LTDALGQLYDAINRVATGHVVVDTSKRAAYASLLHTSGLDVRVVHLVRDPRAVAYAMHKHIERPHVNDTGQDLMHRRSSIGAASEWVLFNEANRVLALKGIPVLRLRYEDLVADPVTALAAICRHAGIAEAVDPTTAELGFVDLTPSHGLAGNPMRFRTGRVRITPDEAWRTEMHPADRSVTTLLTMPWLAHYGYNACVSGSSGQRRSPSVANRSRPNEP
jgi:hypothetical protein